MIWITYVALPFILKLAAGWLLGSFPAVALCKFIGIEDGFGVEVDKQGNVRVKDVMAWPLVLIIGVLALSWKGFRHSTDRLYLACYNVPSLKELTQRPKQIEPHKDSLVEAFEEIGIS